MANLLNLQLRRQLYERDVRHRLLANSLVAPTTAIDNEAAAALGWAISWLSPAQLLAPETGFYSATRATVSSLVVLPSRADRLPARSST
jgi:hypothetical protein